MRNQERLDGQIQDFLKRSNSNVEERVVVALRVRNHLVAFAQQLGVHGEIRAFGSFVNGFQLGGSDLDIAFLTKNRGDPVSFLMRFLSLFKERAHLFGNVTTIFKAAVPLIKVTERQSGLEVDFCVNNRLGVRNSLLLQAYCNYDGRVQQLGWLIKDWAKKYELLGSTDGCLSSYAYMLLVIHYLQRCSPAVVPNLQKLAVDPVPVQDEKWGCDDMWDTKFVEDVAALPASENKQSISSLLLGFLEYYGWIFAWETHAVSIRLNDTGVQIDKVDLMAAVPYDQWYIEDPFDLKHNLAGQCSSEGRQLITFAMREGLSQLLSTGDWFIPMHTMDRFYLKCRITEMVSPQELLECFAEDNLQTLYFPQSPVDATGRMNVVFLEFGTAQDRRQAQTKNEMYVADCQLGLHVSSCAFLQRRLAMLSEQYSTYSMSLYQMQKMALLNLEATHEPQLEPCPEPAPGLPCLLNHGEHLFPVDHMKPVDTGNKAVSMEHRPPIAFQPSFVFPCSNPLPASVLLRGPPGLHAQSLANPNLLQDDLNAKATIWQANPDMLQQLATAPVWPKGKFLGISVQMGPATMSLPQELKAQLQALKDMFQEPPHVNTDEMVHEIEIELDVDNALPPLKTAEDLQMKPPLKVYAEASNL